jgi:EF-hand domain pair
MAQSGEENVIPEESDEARDERIRKLFKQLDVNGTAKITKSDLKQGFQRINHPLQNADSFIDQVMRAADVNHDGVIEVPPSTSTPSVEFVPLRPELGCILMLVLTRPVP